MTEFKVGDQVRLTGYQWDPEDDVPGKGEIVEITDIDPSGTPWFWLDGNRWFVEEDTGWGAELVPDAPTYADVEDSARDYDAELTAALASRLGIPATRVAGFTQTVGKLDAIVPDHYAFPGGVRVHQISGHLTSFGGQAVQYIARSTRLDGRNKGDRVENLKKAQRMIDLEIERLEAE